MFEELLKPGDLTGKRGSEQGGKGVNVYPAELSIAQPSAGPCALPELGDIPVPVLGTVPVLGQHSRARGPCLDVLSAAQHPEFSQFSNSHNSHNSQILKFPQFSQFSQFPQFSNSHNSHNSPCPRFPTRVTFTFSVLALLFRPFFHSSPIHIFAFQAHFASWALGGASSTALPSCSCTPSPPRALPASPV